jgi:predicted permease
MASLLIAYLYIKAKNPAPSAKGLIMFSICFNNTGFIGLPLIKEMLGNEALLLGSMVELICDILIFSIGIMLFQSTSSRNKSIQLRNFISPCFISLLIGLIMFFFHIHLPIIIMKPIQYMSGATTVIAMLLTGAQLGELSFKELFSDKRVYPLCFLRLILIPALLFVTLLCLQQFLPVAEWLSGSFSSANTILIIMAATPIAACTCVFARQYKGDYLFATKSVMISTLLSAFSIPAWLMMTSFLH